MTDLKMVVGDGCAGLALEDGDLELDATLSSAVLISLFTDGRADLEDEVPDGSTDRRGWWAANFLPDERFEAFGSRIWLTERGKLTNETLASAEEFAIESLQWMLDSDVADAVNVTASRVDGRQLLLEIEITRGEALSFPAAWEAFVGLIVETGPARVKVVAA